jgi:hypothetical protein
MATLCDNYKIIGWQPGRHCVEYFYMAERVFGEQDEQRPASPEGLDAISIFMQDPVKYGAIGKENLAAWVIVAELFGCTSPQTQKRETLSRRRIAAIATLTAQYWEEPPTPGTMITWWVLHIPPTSQAHPDELFDQTRERIENQIQES